MSAELHSSEILEVLDADATIEKRASWEGFEFTLLGEGDVEVVNCSHNEPEEHTYTVHIEGGIPSDCTCPAFEYQEGACKHMVAIAIREPILETVTTKPAMRADGGMMVEARENDGSDERPEDCECIEVADLPCWPCYRDGFDEPNPDTGGSDS
jgi:hypothetical protein